ncbi:hypothetical protein NQ314_012973 [Rhamnusium bicolor]|uniref:Phosphorylated adapter RNA export protein n=1 Tax=Rhamnusium bicolor TaxID=1586634 RepID=A0AAV8X9K4_9CUCU|nr:hypothetical protein NQ314_012973 [Rhamnusium bicolor]
MEDDEIEVEEGEVSDASDNNYTPLERPVNYSAIQPKPRFPVNPPSESDEEFQSSDTDSDSDSNTRRSKKPKIKLKPKPQEQNSKRKKYDIWSTRVQEEVLAATLNSCDVTTKDRSRDVETYDFTLGKKYYEELEEKKNNKRTREDRKKPNFRQKKRSNSDEKLKGNKRVILDLAVDLNSSAEEMAKDMANKLCEEKEELILKVINTMGKQKAIDFFKETQKIEEEGGMLIMKMCPYVKPPCKLTAASRAKLLPDLLTRAELLACQNPTRKVKDGTEETDFINPPPTPETDGHENSGDGMDGGPLPVVNGNDSLNSTREKPNTYDEDFLDIGCSNDMDLF